MRRGLAPSRTAAQELISRGAVLVSGTVAERAARMVAASEPVVLGGPPPRFVGRGGEKLDAALDHFAPDVSGRRALDAGASTGGFTDCLLQRGASSVVAVDVGRGQLHQRLRTDGRVEVHERTDIRLFTTSPFDLIVCDVSFISLETVCPALLGLAQTGADLLLLVKPQFEAGRAAVSRGRGVIRDPEEWGGALSRVRHTFEGAGAAMMGAMVSPLRGADGNVEFVTHFKVGHRATPFDIDSVVAQAIRERGGGPSGRERDHR